MTKSRQFIDTIENRKALLLWLPLFLSLSLFIFNIIFTLHGYSLPLLSKYISSTAPDFTLFGQLQSIRSDDWAVSLPHAMSQFFQKPQFPVLNTNIGSGQNMLLLSNVPVGGWFYVFRPQVLGFIFGPSVGFSWLWGFNVYGTFACSYLLFVIISKKSIFLSLGAALCLLFSPFVQFWSLNCATFLIFSTLSIIFFYGMLNLEKPILRILCALGLGWSSVCLAHTFYPPYVIGMSLVVFFCCCAIFLKRYYDFGIGNCSERIVWVLLSILIIVWGGYTLFDSIKDPLVAMINTEYPGRRVNTGGQFELWRFLITHLMNFTKIDFSIALANVCEAAGFYWFFPFSIILLVLNWHQIGVNKYPLFILIACGLIFHIWLFFPVPEWFGTITLLNRVPENRLKLGLGSLDLIIFVWAAGQVTGRFRELLKRQEYWISFGMIAAMWLLVLYFVFKDFTSFGISLSKKQIGLIFACELIFVFLALFAPKLSVSWRFICILPIVFNFNPVIHGGINYLYESPLSREILKLNDSSKSPSKWIVYGSWPLGNYLRALGVNSLTGTQFTPDLNFWRQFDLKGEFKQVYNRYAAVSFSQTQAKSIEFKLIQTDAFSVIANPSSDVLRELGYDYFLVEGNCGIFCENRAFEKIFEYENKTIFVRKRF